MAKCKRNGWIIQLLSSIRKIIKGFSFCVSKHLFLKTGIHCVYNIAFWKSWRYYIRSRKGYKRASQIKDWKASIGHWKYSMVMSKFFKDAISIITCSILSFWHLHVRYLIAFYHALHSYWKYCHKKARGMKKQILGEFALLLIEYYEPFNSIQPIFVQTCSNVLLLFCVKYISCTETKSWLDLKIDSMVPQN